MEKKKKTATKKKATTAKKVAVKKTTQKKTAKKKKTAFTLIELLAVIIILGMLMIVAIPSVTSYISDSRKAGYIATIKNLLDGTRTKVNEGKLEVYDTATTYYIPYDAIETETGVRSPYGEFKKAYAVVTYNEDGFDYYWAGMDTAKMGLYLTYSDLLDKDKIVTEIKDISTDIAVCGKESIVVFDKDGNVTETKDATECIEPRDYHEGGSINCKYKLVTDYGSFSATEDVKEVCINLDTNYTYTTYSKYTNSMYQCNSQNYTLLNVTIDTRKISDDFYFRIYDSSAKNQLLAEIKKSDFPKYTYYLNEASTLSYVGVTKIFPKNGTGLGYYAEYSSDFQREFNNHNASWDYYCVGETPSQIQYSGAWLKNSSDINKIEILKDSLDNIPLTSVCDNQNPEGGISLNGFTRSGNTYRAEIGISCERLPK